MENGRFTATIENNAGESNKRVFFNQIRFLRTSIMTDCIMTVLIFYITKCLLVSYFSLYR
jgi:hypothetical protein